MRSYPAVKTSPCGVQVMARTMSPWPSGPACRAQSRFKSMAGRGLIFHKALLRGSASCAVVLVWDGTDTEHHKLRG